MIPDKFEQIMPQPIIGKETTNLHSFLYMASFSIIQKNTFFRISPVEITLNVIQSHSKQLQITSDFNPFLWLLPANLIISVSKVSKLFFLKTKYYHWTKNSSLHFSDCPF
jgi:hypothetical protein